MQACDPDSANLTNRHSAKANYFCKSKPWRKNCANQNPYLAGLPVLRFLMLCMVVSCLVISSRSANLGFIFPTSCKSFIHLTEFGLLALIFFTSVKRKVPTNSFWIKSCMSAVHYDGV